MENGRFLFLIPPFRGLATYDVHIRHIGKSVGDSLSVLTQLFLLGATTKALRVNID